ncbi:hypothetical protein ACT6QG_15730 [Xanthobacter sp. TB0136]
MGFELSGNGKSRPRKDDRTIQSMRETEEKHKSGFTTRFMVQGFAQG